LVAISGPEVASAGRRPFLVVGTAFRALGWWLPCVLRVPKLALLELVETILLTAQDFELVLPLQGVGIVGLRLAFGRPTSIRAVAAEDTA
jgi:hypothetical protein